MKILKERIEIALIIVTSIYPVDKYNEVLNIWLEEQPEKFPWESYENLLFIADNESKKV